MARTQRTQTHTGHARAVLPFAGRLLATFAAVLALLLLLLLGAYALPAGPVQNNIYRSVALLQEEGLYPEFFGFKLFQMDNYTDTVMLFEAATADEAPPLTAMMTNTAYNVDNFETLPDDLAFYLEAKLGLATGAQNTDITLTPFSYARYWHGYLIYLRPLLLFFTYGQVRVCNYLVLGLLLAALLWLLWRRCGPKAAVWFALSQLAVTVWWVPRQLQFFSCFAIAYAGCVWVLARPRTGRALARGLLVLGMCTAFFDLLVTPILTLGLPVAVWLLCPGARAKTPRRAAGCVVGASLLWGAGYAGCWASKWVLAAVVTGNDVVGDAIHQAGVRTTAATWHGMELSWGNIFRFVYGTLAQKGLFWPLLAAGLLAAAAVCLCVKSRAALANAAPMALCALMAPAWLCVLRTHSIQHGWFTWRSLCVLVFCGGAALCRACSLKVGLARLKNCGKTKP